LAKQRFKVGNIFRLKSGGLRWSGYDGSDLKTPIGSPVENVWCKWFGGRKLESGPFDPDMIILSSEVEKTDKNDGVNSG